MLEWMILGEETRRLIDLGYESLRQARIEMGAAWGFGHTKRWDADFDAGTITFTDPGLVVTAPIQVIGSYIPSRCNWLWAWANPHVDPPLARHATLARDYAYERNIPTLLSPEITCPEEDPWMLVSLVSALAKTNGAYRGADGDDLYVFMTFGEPSVQREKAD